IVAETNNDERKAILEMFRRGEVTKLASGMTLEEGVDVPDAQVGIIISGSGSNREYLQRIGRLLRPKNEPALMIELVTRGTMDQQLSLRRRKFKEWIT
ncbi:MAG: helicase-related protein, partial [Candidatus Nezhaarchaeales archaeon]